MHEAPLTSPCLSAPQLTSLFISSGCRPGPYRTPVCFRRYWPIKAHGQYDFLPPPPHLFFLLCHPQQEVSAASSVQFSCSCPWLLTNCRIHPFDHKVNTEEVWTRLAPLLPFLHELQSNRFLSVHAAAATQTHTITQYCVCPDGESVGVFWGFFHSCQQLKGI